MAVTCPECDSPIDIDEFDVDVGDELSCSECGALLRVATDSPVELESAEDDDDEDDDDDDFDDEDEGDDEDDADDDGEDEDTEDEE
jgi:alpha-aminoadipate/glutamate carrier protein LysW